MARRILSTKSLLGFDMVYLLCGEDTKSKHASYGKLMKLLPKEVERFFIGKSDFDETQVESFYSGSGLFFKRCAVIFTNVFEKEETLDFVLRKLNFLMESGNDFVFLEGKLDKLVLDAFKEAGVEVRIFDLPKEKKEKFNNFLLANALGERGRLELWICFRQAVDKGVGLEELVGVLFWKAKDMLIKRDFRKFSEPELKNFTGKLSYLLPEARKNGLDAECEMERFLLEAV